MAGLQIPKILLPSIHPCPRYASLLRRFYDRLYWKSPLHQLARPALLTQLPRLQSRYNCALKAETNSNVDGYFERDCVFVHVPKTGGSSIKAALYRQTPRSHLTARGFFVLYGRRRFNQAFKFSFVRNPWDRLVSAYYFYRGLGEFRPYFVTSAMIEESRRKPEEYRHWLPASFEGFIAGWLQRHQRAFWFLFVPQVDYLRLSPSGPIVMDFVGRFENLAHDFEFVREKLGIEGRLGHLRESVRPDTDYRHEYSSRTREIVAEMFAPDVKEFGYSF